MIPGLLGALSGGFRPTDIAGCLAWFDFSAMGHADNDVLTTDPDQTGSLTIAAATGAPTFKANALAAKTALYFDGNDGASTGGVTLGGERSIFVVGKITVAGMICEYGNTLGDDDSGYIYSYGGSSLVKSGGLLSCFDVAITTWQITTSPMSVIQVCNSSNASHKLYRNGVELARGNEFNTNDPNSSGVPHSLYVGHRTGPDLFMTGHIAELAIYNAFIGFNGIGQLTNYAMQKWGSESSLEPVNTVVPALSAAGWTVGQVASCDTGTWTNEPTSYAYQWQRKDGGYTDIPGATSSSYLLAAADAGKNVRCGVTPSNAFATGTVAYSLDSDLIL